MARLKRRLSKLRPRSRACRVVIDVPAAGSRVESGMILAQGWATYGHGLPVVVRVRLGNSATYNADMHVHRPEVAEKLGWTQEENALGWNAAIDLSEAEFGPFPIVVEALAGGVVATTTAIIEVVPPKLAGGQDVTSSLGSLDGLDDLHETSKDILRVSGWCLFPGSHVSRVEVELDGVSVAEARIHLARNDIAADHPFLVDAPVAGFDADVLVEKIARPAEVVVTVMATSLDDRTWRSPPRRVVLQRRRLPSDDGRAEQLVERTATMVREARRPRDGGVLVFTHDLGLGGGQLWLWDLLRQVHPEPDTHCKVIAFRDGPLRKRLEAIGIEVQVSAECDVTSSDAYEGRIRELALLADMSGCGCALLNTLDMFPAADAAQRAGLATVWAIHESFTVPAYLEHLYRIQGFDPYVRVCMERALGRASALVFEARQTSELFAPYASADHRFVVDYGVDLGDIDQFRSGFERDEARRAAGFTDDDTVALVIGVFEPRKGQASAVAAFHELAGVHPDLRLALVGAQHSPYSNAVRDQARRSGVSKRIEIVEVTPDIYRWYGISDLFLCPADLESLPRSVLEAMAFELPVLSTAVFGLADLIRHNETGWFTRPRDLESLTGALHWVLKEERARWAEIGAAGRQLVAQRHGVEGYAMVFGQALRRLATNPEADVTHAFAVNGERTTTPLGHRS